MGAHELDSAHTRAAARLGLLLLPLWWLRRPLSNGAAGAA